MARLIFPDHSPSPVPRAAARWRARLAVLALLVAGVAFATGPGGQPVARAPAPAPGDCQNLLHQFDVAWPAHRDSARAVTARHSRDLGAADCDGGRYAEGVHHLRRALHDIGLKPVKIVPAGSPH